MRALGKAVFYVTLVVFLLVFLLPVNSAGAARSFPERGGFQVLPSIDDRYGSSPGINAPAAPISPQPGTGQTDNKTPQNSYTPFDRTGKRDGGFYVPAVPPSTPSTAPISPTLPPSTPPAPPPSDPSPPAPPPAGPETPSGLTADEAKACNLLNEFRIKNGLPPLQVDANLTRVARLKAQDIIDKNYFGHVSPTYGTISQMLRNEGIRFSRAGENLSKAGNVSQAQLQLEYSTQGHRENMLNPGYNLVGIGVLKLQKTPGIIMVQLFTD